MSQTANERGRLVVDGHRTDDRTRCALLLVQETGDTWALYPHGAGQLGVRLSSAVAQTVAQAMLGGLPLSTDDSLATE